MSVHDVACTARTSHLKDLSRTFLGTPPVQVCFTVTSLGDAAISASALEPGFTLSSWPARPQRRLK